MPSESPINRALARKRERDRRAQRNVRDRRNTQTQMLQARVYELENDLRSAQQACQRLSIENEILRECQGSQPHAFASPLQLAGDGRSVPGQLAWHQTGFHEGQPTPAQHSVSYLIDSLPSTTLSGYMSSSLAPIEAVLTPLHDVSDFVSESFRSAWAARPDLVVVCPDSPHPAELLYGSKTNFLANTICSQLRDRSCREPERLAVLWLTYHGIKWITSPNHKRYLNLQPFQRPVPEQFSTTHPLFIDFIMWPELRVNLMQHHHDHEPAEMLSMFLRCIKIQWPCNEPILEVDSAGWVHMKPTFMQTISKLENWALTEEFWCRYPDLVKGMDKRTALWNYPLAV